MPTGRCGIADPEAVDGGAGQHEAGGDQHREVEGLRRGLLGGGADLGRDVRRRLVERRNGVAELAGAGVDPRHPRANRGVEACGHGHEDQGVDQWGSNP
jgi:hypothetical protein